ncbi:MAG: acetyl-CoA carboxylase, carboxyltransferase subunit beta, partial [Pseudomonadota bacterium]
WLTNYVRPRIRALVAPRDVPEDLWKKCPSCGTMLYTKDLVANLWVCPECSHHMRLGAKDRLDMLFDEAAYELVELPKIPADPLKFRDNKRYVDRLRDAQTKTKRDDAIMVAHGKLGGSPTVIAAFDFSFMGGSMGIAVGEGIVTAARLAVAQEAALIVIPASGGARMQEGILSLMQMPRTVVASQQVKEAGLPYIVVFTDPTTGGVSASFAMLGDVHIAETGAQIGFAGARVIEETMRQTLPDGFQRAEFLHSHGMVDMVVHRKELKSSIARVLQLLREPHKEPTATDDAAATAAAIATSVNGADTGGELTSTAPANGEVPQATEANHGTDSLEEMPADATKN